ncbi:hypothetical protein, partial [Pseudomonas sp. P7758]|uniref:hypothetical protein n=1 Tax=Pseudomonas sp. P7758 TaxID=2738830 RepID=UPI001C42EC16
PVTIDTGQPVVQVLAEQADASPWGFFAEAGASSTGSCFTNAVRAVFGSRTIGAGLDISSTPAFNGTAAALTGTA